jgi:endonuclease YncB( thermonuclease family)
MYRATLRRLIDADTLVLTVDLGFRVSAAITVRVADIDAPERYSEEGKRASKFVLELLKPADGELRELLVQSYHDQMTFARWVVDLWVQTGINTYVSFAEHLIAGGYARMSNPRSTH